MWENIKESVWLIHLIPSEAEQIHRSRFSKQGYRGLVLIYIYIYIGMLNKGLRPCVLTLKSHRVTELRQRFQADHTQKWSLTDLLFRRLLVQKFPLKLTGPAESLTLLTGPLSVNPAASQDLRERSDSTFPTCQERMWELLIAFKTPLQMFQSYSSILHTIFI